MIHLNIGSNLCSKFGNKFQNISMSVKFLKDSKIKVKKISNYFETPSYPNKNFPKFVNVGVLVESSLSSSDFLKKISIIEKKMGRLKNFKNSPRVCDIDIIDFKGIIKKTKKLQLPHPRCSKRNFVLYPIKEIAPNWQHPILKKKIDDLIEELTQKSRIEITRLKKSVMF